MPEKIIDIIKHCDSWSSVEEITDHKPDEGRYGVMVFFSAREDAAEFYGQLAEISTRKI